jgi:hypothetical protein
MHGGCFWEGGWCIPDEAVGRPRTFRVTIFTMRLAVTLLLFAVSGFAAEKSILHCFAFTPRAEAAEADFKAYYAATDKLAQDFDGITRVWYGKLRNPLTQFRLDPDSQKKLSPGTDKVEGATVTRVRREYGTCMEFRDTAAWSAYEKHPAHDAWVKVYDKVRVPGTTTYQILPQP